MQAGKSQRDSYCVQSRVGDMMNTQRLNALVQTRPAFAFPLNQPLTSKLKIGVVEYRS